MSCLGCDLGLLPKILTTFLLYFPKLFFFSFYRYCCPVFSLLFLNLVRANLRLFFPYLLVYSFIYSQQKKQFIINKKSILMCLLAWFSLIQSSGSVETFFFCSFVYLVLKQVQTDLTKVVCCICQYITNSVSS